MGRSAGTAYLYGAEQHADLSRSATAACRHRDRHLYVLGRRQRSRRRFSGRHRPRRHVAPGHDRRLAECAVDRSVPAAVSPGRRPPYLPRHRTCRLRAGRCLSCVSVRLRKAADCRRRGRAHAFDRHCPRHARRRSARTEPTSMSAATWFGVCGAMLVGVGLFGLITNPEALRKILAFNLVGSGVFLIFGAIARRGAAVGLGGDPVPQALVITAIVVAFAGTALAIALLLRLFEETGEATLDSGESGDANTG